MTLFPESIFPPKREDFRFGQSPKTTGNAQVRFLLARQPRIGLLAARKRGRKNLSGHFPDLPLTASPYTFSPLSFSPPYPHIILCAIILDFHMQTFSPNLQNIINLLFPFRYSMNPDILIFSGLQRRTCTLSGYTSPSTISTPFSLALCSYNFPYCCSFLVIKYSSLVLWSKDYVVFANPACMR